MAGGDYINNCWFPIYPYPYDNLQGHLPYYTSVTYYICDGCGGTTTTPVRVCVANKFGHYCSLYCAKGEKSPFGITWTNSTTIPCGTGININTSDGTINVVTEFKQAGKNFIDSIKAIRDFQ